MKNIMQPQHDFARVPKANIPRSVFNRTHNLKTTFDAGYLIPIFWDDVLPGDTHMLDLTCLARLSTPIVPIMDNIYLDFFFFFTPLRLLQTNFVKMMGERLNPADSITYSVPIVDVSGEGEMTLADYFGLPINAVNAVKAAAYHFRNYNLVWNNWFRDGNLQDSEVVDLDDGPDDIADYQLLRRGKRHDYFTSALPWLQRGTAVDLPLGSSAPIVTDAAQDGDLDIYSSANSAYRQLITINGNTQVAFGAGAGAEATSLYADLSAATASTINELRQAFQIQRLLERDARGGTGRYIEILKAHYGVVSPDFRFQRPELLATASMQMNVTPIARTNDFGAAQGADLSGYAVSSKSGIGFTASFTEHGVLLGLVSARADLTYQNGIDRHWSKSTRYDFYWPALATIGEQALLNKEIYFTDEANGSDSATNVATFGYQERYAEYRYKPSRITGLFRGDAAGSIDIWHLGQNFGALPTLNAAFIVDDPPIDNVIATPAEPHIIYDSYLRYKSVRPMPVFGVPGLIDHL